MKKKYLAFEVSEDTSGIFVNKIVEKELSEDIPEGNVLINVKYSSLNYKDALSANGNKGVTRKYPHVPGIDAAGTVEVSNSALWKSGDQVLVTGFDLGMNTNGGFGQFITVPESWIVRLSPELSVREAMIYGTAGFTAGLSVQALLRNGITPEKGVVAVSGSTGGVGSLAVAILAKLGFQMAAISSKEDAISFLKSLGADKIVARNGFEDRSGKALLKPQFAAAIDTVGGNILATLIKSLHYEGVVTTCGMVGGGELNTSVFPFILKGIQLIGIDSVEIPLEKRLSVWEHLASDWKPGQLNDLAHNISLAELPEHIDRIYTGKMKGRAVLEL
ncbi:MULTISPECIES: YhdH/YhfP family quinone oxidoreductase [Elizabethkingia]|uniref:YhdH/YhfP family quinone oxidoreductase n=1 Tax=Elizabethkingia TaxID=308865 RepID=UPI0009997C0C|nr:MULTISPECIES: YhdH/YhfP family quinone oxidoreductase [Elizabethkingia]AQX90594.1 quinone oxidoreductase [Elizabethkingia anophelis]EHM7981744.1 YhdH/YhfP family quinone oxidoreductase [Elizabethkingia anophelis]EHM8032242.1 YhdH/YhfP family quinone oxidoreductase [Elizabethkingia anophelis]EHZ9535196.1 YhdH/YhfP family quinone oxidoreductase [Elizabethkingia anophelis]EKU3673106.1 YhdH/YhfP family quinone oxidoreductase [Elizabethkingia anophelis]